jgi:putative CocE/NonD family hydrolase
MNVDNAATPEAQNRAQAGRAIRIVGGVPTGGTFQGKYRLRTLQNVMTPMRDGVLLAMDIIRPDETGRYPVILMRTPYNKVAHMAKGVLEPWARNGYVVAVQDCRGRFNSDGDFQPYRQEHDDGFDTIEWLAAQEWCDGNVGMIGGSYVAQTQWFAASQAPKALKAIVPTCSPPGHTFLNEPFYGGAMLMGIGEWTFLMGRRSEQVAGLEGIQTTEKSYFNTMPLTGMAELAGVSNPVWTEWMSHPCHDEYWRSCDYEQYWSCMIVPALNVTGWWDMNFLGAPRNFVGMREQGSTKEAREGQRLVIGPWPHWTNQTRILNDLDFGPDAVTDLGTYTRKFFDYWLRDDKDNGLCDDARVHIFVIGANEWWEADEWPLPQTEFTSFYLHSDGGANTHRGNGRLSQQYPLEEPVDEFLSDPLDPVRVTWNKRFQRRALRRYFHEIPSLGTDALAADHLGDFR